jgi:two-component system, cell cycle sensor histidine kinase and response regulator CckA
VRIDSEPGTGTIVTAVWPATEQASKQSKSAPVSQVDRRATGQVVLVVEDEAPLRDATRRMLARNGYAVLTAAGGGDAIEVVRNHAGPIDLLLTDMIMPHMLGTDVAAAITALRPGIHVLYMSGYARSSLTRSDALQPERILLEKPFSENELLRLVGRALEDPKRRRARPQRS